MLSRRHAVCVALAASLISCNDGITDADRVGINFSAAADTIFKFSSLPLTPIVTKGGAVTTVPITWTSSDTLVARVNSTGVVTGVGSGSALITARVESAQASTTIVVDSLLEVRVTPSNETVGAGDSIRLVGIGVGALGTAQLDSDLTWVSSDESVATVRANGTVLAWRQGVITITASYYIVSGAASLTVLPDADEVTINFSAAADTIFKFSSLPLTPIVTKGGAVTTLPITWISSDTLVARVSSAGIVTGVGRGTALITAQVESAQASTTIVVDSLFEVRVTPSNETLGAGDSIRLVGIGVGPLGTRQLDTDLRWVSSDTSVAAVRANGTVVAWRPGVISITASHDIVTGAGSLTVLPANLNRQAACSGAGTLHRGAMSADTWREADNPHLLLDTVTVTRLTIEPGVVVCGLPGSMLAIKSSVPSPGGSTDALLDARGTADQPIRFTAADTMQKWLGINENVAFSATITHSVFEFASVSVGSWGGPVLLHDSRFRYTTAGFCAPNFASRVDIRRTIFEMDNVCVSEGTFADNVIRGGGLTISGDGNGGTLAIDGTRIENSPGVGLTVLKSDRCCVPTVTSSRPLRIIGAGSYPVDIPLEMFGQMWPTRESQDSLFGNAKDTLSLWGNAEEEFVQSPLLLRDDLPWIVAYKGIYFPGGVNITALTIEPGASLTVTVGRLVARGSVTALGTAANPIKISTSTCEYCGLILTDTALSQLSNVNFTGRTITANEQHRVTLQGINSTGWIELGSSGSSIADSKIHNVPAGMFSNGLGAIVVRASGVQVLRCDVTDNGGDGIHVTSEVSGNVEVHECNLARNAGFGVNNRAAFTVDARRNWWGDPAGPNGPSGDGVSGNVDASDPLPAPRP